MDFFAPLFFLLTLVSSIGYIWCMKFKSHFRIKTFKQFKNSWKNKRFILHELLWFFAFQANCPQEVRGNNHIVRKNSYQFFGDITQGDKVFSYFLLHNSGKTRTWSSQKLFAVTCGCTAHPKKPQKKFGGPKRKPIDTGKTSEISFLLTRRENLGHRKLQFKFDWFNALQPIGEKYSLILLMYCQKQTIRN